MKEDEAKEILNDFIKEFKNMSYDELSRYQGKNNIYAVEANGVSGKKYQIEMYSFIEDQNLKSLRVVVTLFKRAIVFPFFNNSLSDDFIILPNGQFLD